MTIPYNKKCPLSLRDYLYREIRSALKGLLDQGPTCFEASPPPTTVVRPSRGALVPEPVIIGFVEASFEFGIVGSARRIAQAVDYLVKQFHGMYSSLPTQPLSSVCYPYCHRRNAAPSRNQHHAIKVGHKVKSLPREYPWGVL